MSLRVRISPRAANQIFLLHGDQDTVVLPHHSRDFAAALEEHGCEVLFLEVPGKAHRDEIVGPYQKEVADFLTR